MVRFACPSERPEGAAATRRGPPSGGVARLRGDAERRGRGPRPNAWQKVVPYGLRRYPERVRGGVGRPACAGSTGGRAGPRRRTRASLASSPRLRLGGGVCGGAVELGRRGGGARSRRTDRRIGSLPGAEPHIERKRSPSATSLEYATAGETPSGRRSCGASRRERVCAPRTNRYRLIDSGAAPSRPTDASSNVPSRPLSARRPMTPMPWCARACADGCFDECGAHE